MAKEPTPTGGTVARSSLIGNIAAPVSTGSFAQVSASNVAGGGTLYMAATANVVIRFSTDGGTTSSEMTYLSSWGPIPLGDIDPRYIYVRSAGAATTAHFWYA